MGFQSVWLQQLERRTMAFNAAVIYKCGPYGRETSLQPLVDELIRSSLRVGAMYRQAYHSVYERDFSLGVNAAGREAISAGYWLDLLFRLCGNEDIFKLRNEADNLSTLFQKMVLTLDSGR